MTFKQDDDETPMLFRVKRGKQYEADGVTAVLPCEPADLRGHTMTCYAHVGQHSACDVGWYLTTRAATPAEYADLKQELEGAPYGYRVKVYKRMQPFMRDARRQEAVRLASHSRAA